MSHGAGTPQVDAGEITILAGSGAARLPWIGGAVGLAGILGSAALGASQPAQMAFSWLVAFLFCISIALGALFFVLVLYATKAGWGVSVRRLSENAMATLPVFALLFVPVVWGAPHLFSWWNGPGDDHLLQVKAPYLNSGFFLARAAVYFVVWSAIALWYSSRSARQDATGDYGITRLLTAASGPSLILYALTITFAAIDWIMVLDPYWYSTIFGVYFFAGSLVGVFSFLVIVVAGLQSAGYVRHVIHLGHYHDLGKLLFAFVVFWTYIGFSQYFLIWYGNIPEETIWFRERLHGGWLGLSLVLALGHFVVPFFFLMPKAIKVRPALLVTGAAWMLLMHLADIYWLVMPNLHHDGPSFGLADIASLAAVGGVFVGAFGWMLKSRKLIPMRDPRLDESLSLDHA
ncbi:MAG: quinol:cytochrome C oxidoreductase [Candidatus Polarisedimenticolia bacterium]